MNDDEAIEKNMCFYLPSYHWFVVIYACNVPGVVNRFWVSRSILPMSSEPGFEGHRSFILLTPLLPGNAHITYA